MVLPPLCESLLLYNVKPHLPSLHSEKKEFVVFRSLLQLIPGLEAWLMVASEEEAINIADLVRLTTNHLSVSPHVLL